jgi:DNA-directed RNA polymerase subunit M/transcription elongation factor TFIIS
MPSPMSASESSLEWLRLAAHYRAMTDGELISVARQNSKLTEVAQQVLTCEVSRRHLQIPPEEPLPPPKPEPSTDSPYAQDRELVEICSVWSFADALRLQWLLDRAGIPFFMGPEKATGVDGVTSDFAKGVIVQVMRIGLPWVYEAMRDYFPKDEPAIEQVEIPATAVCCPKCRSQNVIFKTLLAEGAATEVSIQRFDWTCDDCGNNWEDDGIAKCSARVAE